MYVRMCFHTLEGTQWLGYWGKHMKSEGFKSVKEYQKVNHFPGSYSIGRKDRLWRSLSRMQVLYGKKVCTVAHVRTSGLSDDHDMIIVLNIYYCKYDNELSMYVFVITLTLLFTS